MRKFKRWFRNWIDDSSNQLVAEGKISRIESIDQPERCIRFSVYYANGGRVIETNRYDRLKDRNFPNLYIVTSDQSLGDQIEKIITMESLKS